MKIVLFGAGDIARQVRDRLPARFEVIAHADNDARKHGTTLRGVPVVRPADIAALAPEGVMLAVVARHVPAVKAQLRDLGVLHLEIPAPPEVRLWMFEAIAAEQDGVIGTALVAELKAYAEINGSIPYDIGCAGRMKRACDRHGVTGRVRAVHAGMSRSLGIELFSALRWGWSWASVEPYPQFPASYPFDVHFRAMHELMSVLHADAPLLADGFEPDAASPLRWKVGDATLEYHPGWPLERLAGDTRRFDLCCSVAVLEHVLTPGQFVDTSRALLRPGGLGVHVIDLRDHHDFSQPLEFLTFDDDAWRRRAETMKAEFLNRLRLSDYRRLFVEGGFDDVEENVLHRNDVAYVDGIRPRLAPRYQHLDDDDLVVCSVEFVVRRRADA